MPKRRNSKKASKAGESQRSPSRSPPASPPGSPPQSSYAPPTAVSSTGSPSSATKRLLHELSDNASHPNPALLHLGPIADDQMLEWEAVLKGPAPQKTTSSSSSSTSFSQNLSTASPYSNGLWLLSISIPDNYPHKPPTITFRTPICHPNISISTGEICLSLLTDEHWSPMYTISSTLGAIHQLLSDPVNESPLNVDIANLYRQGDVVGAESLIRYWTAERRWKGEGKGGWISQV